MFDFFSRLFGGGDKPAQVDLEPFRTAIRERDHHALEGLRDRITPAIATALMGDWSADLDRDTKDAMLAVLMDQPVAKVPALRPLMEDALDAPSVESRAYALCSLTGDWGLFDGFLVGGSVQPEPVDKAITAWRDQQ